MNDKETSKRKSLKGTRIVILGGTSGFGLATAIAAADDGAEVIVVSSQQKRVDEALNVLPAGSKGFAVNLTDEGKVKELFSQIGEFDHLVFTAGESLLLGDLPGMDFENAKGFFNLRFWGAIMATKYASPQIRAGGSITLTNGLAGKRPMKGWIVGASMMGAVESLTRALAVDLAPIRVNAVCGGLVRTNLWSDIPDADREALFTEYGGKLLTGKVGEAAEIAEAYLYLMKGSFTTGQIIVADGGGELV